MKDPVSREPANRASLFAFANLVTLIMSFYNRQLQVILQMYLSGNLSPFSEVYLYLKFTVSGQFLSTVCAFHGYAFGGVLSKSSFGVPSVLLDNILFELIAFWL